MNRLLLFIVVVSIFCCFSCRQDHIDDMNVVVKDRFVILLPDTYWSKEYFLVTNQKGQIVYQSSRSDLSVPRIEFELTDELKNDIFDVTFIRDFSEYFFSISTYRDVKNGFLFRSNAPIKGCVLDKDIEVNGGQYQLEVLGITDFDELFLPGYTLPTVQTDSSIILTTSSPSKVDFFISLLPKGEDKFKCILLKNEDWLKKENLFIRKLSIDSFSIAEVKEIQLSQMDSWFVNSNFIDSDNRITLISQIGKKNYQQKGDKVQLVLPPNFNFSNLALEIRGNNFYLQKVYSEIPTTIDLYNPEISFNASDIDYDYTVDGEFDFVTLDYFYTVNNYGSSWTLYQRADAESSYKRPIIPENVLNDFPKVKKGLEHTNRISISAYKMHSETSFFQENYLNYDGCAEYSVKESQ